MTEPILIKKGDGKVLLNGEPPKADCRVISEENYQRLKAGQHETPCTWTKGNEPCEYCPKRITALHMCKLLQDTF